MPVWSKSMLKSGHPVRKQRGALVHQSKAGDAKECSTLRCRVLFQDCCTGQTVVIYIDLHRSALTYGIPCVLSLSAMLIAELLYLFCKIGVDCQITICVIFWASEAIWNEKKMPLWNRKEKKLAILFRT